MDAGKLDFYYITGDQRHPNMAPKPIQRHKYHISHFNTIFMSPKPTPTMQSIAAQSQPHKNNINLIMYYIYFIKRR